MKITIWEEKFPSVDEFPVVVELGYWESRVFNKPYAYEAEIADWCSKTLGEDEWMPYTMTGVHNGKPVGELLAPDGKTCRVRVRDLATAGFIKEHFCSSSKLSKAFGDWIARYISG